MPKAGEIWQYNKNVLVLVLEHVGKMPIDSMFEDKFHCLELKRAGGFWPVLAGTISVWYWPDTKWEKLT